MKRIILLNLLLLGLIFSASAQRFPFGQVDQVALDMKKYDKDASAHAVVIKEYGETGFIPADFGYTNILHEYHVKIKILDKEGLKYGTIEIPVYNGDVLGKEGLKYGKIDIPLYNSDMSEMSEEVLDVTGITTYTDENGAVKTVELRAYDVNTIKQNKNHRVVKFTMPALKPGCVIEYTYRLVSPFLLNMPPWSFQSYIPKIISTYATSVPAFWSYNTILRGGLKLTRNTSNTVPKCFTLGATKTDCVYSLYEITDVPAFVEESYMAPSKNYMSGLYFELSYYSTKHTFQPVKVATDWEAVDQQFQDNIFFGDQLKKIDFLKSKIALLLTEGTDQLTQAKAVYKYIQRNMKWDSINARGSENIRRALDKRTGDAGDINLLLVAALNVAGINTAPVLTSTRNHGMINKQYPSMNAFDYIIAEVNIDNKTYLLDATDPALPFGVLPLRCINDKGRVLSLDKPSHWIDLNTNQAQNSTYLLNLTMQDDGKITGTLTSRFTSYSAYQKRLEIKRFKDADAYAADLDQQLSGLKITGSEITNLDSLDYPLTESFNIEADVAVQNDKLSFNPYLINRIIANPFKSEDRIYPVDLGISSDAKVIINVSYPKNYSIENAPQSATLSLPEQGGRFSITSQVDNNSLSLTSTLSLKKPIYTVDEYQQLRELYDKVIEQQKQELIFKKK